MKHRKSLSSFLLILLAVSIVNSVFVMQRVQAADGYPVADFIWYPESPAVGEWFICNISSLALNLEYPLVAFNWEIVGPATPMGPVNYGDLVLHADSVGWVTVTFTVWNTLGLSDTIQKSIYVQLVRADFTYSPDNPKVGQEIIFDASPSVGEIGPYIWNFDGEIESSNIKTTSHSFPSEGSYTVTLTVFSSSGTPFSKNLETMPISAAHNIKHTHDKFGGYIFVE